MAHDVFISHAHKDKKIADAVCEKLESAGTRCWIAPRDLSAGEDWTEAVRNAIGSSRVIVLVFSENANMAPHIEREIAQAFYTRRIIVPLRFADTLPRRDLLFYLCDACWFDAFSPPPEQHLEAATARIKGLLLGPAFTSKALPPRSAKNTAATLKSLNSWKGELRTSHYRTQGILKPMAIAASVVAVVWLLWLASQKTEHGASLEESKLPSMYSGASTSPDSSAQTIGDASGSTPRYAFTRFGLWEAANAGPAPSVQQGPQDTPSNTPAEQSASGTPSPRSDVDQIAAREAGRLATQDSASVKPAQEDPTRIISSGQPAWLTSAWESHGPPLPPPGIPPAPHDHHQQDQGPDRTITWRSWQQLPAHEVRIRTGDRYLGDENWEHYLGFELAAISQKVIKVSLIHLGGETVANVELSPRVRAAIVKIVNHHMTAGKNMWGWTLQEIKQNGP